MNHHPSKMEHQSLCNQYIHLTKLGVVISSENCNPIRRTKIERVWFIRQVTKEIKSTNELFRKHFQFHIIGSGCIRRVIDTFTVAITWWCRELRFVISPTLKINTCFSTFHFVYALSLSMCYCWILTCNPIIQLLPCFPSILVILNSWSSNRLLLVLDCYYGLLHFPCEILRIVASSCRVHRNICKLSGIAWSCTCLN